MLPTINEFIYPASPSRINAYEIQESSDPRYRFDVFIASPELPIMHVQRSLPGGFIKTGVSPSDQYQVCLRYSGQFPETLPDLLDLLKDRLCLPTGNWAPLDLALALDYYKIPPAEDGGEWKNTNSGELVSRAKYWVSDPGMQRLCREKIVEKVADTIRRHPILNSASRIVSVPGSKGNGSSVGESIAAGVATRLGRPLISTIGPVRPERKGDQAASIAGLFSVPEMIHGNCVIVDDVWRSGETAAEVGRAARTAGASAVHAVVAAKTMRR